MQRKIVPKASLKAYLPIALTLVLLGLTSLLPLSQFYLGFTTLYLLPIMVILSTYTAGAAGGAVIIAAASCINAAALDTRALLATSGYLLPVYCVTLFALVKKPPFLHAVMQAVIVYAATVTVLFLSLQWATTGTFGARMAAHLVHALNKLPFRDPLLYTLSRAGFLSLSAQETGVPVFIESATEIIFTDAARNQLLAQIASRASILLRSLFPTLLTQGALLNVPLSVALAQYLAPKWRYNFPGTRGPLEDMPPFSAWYIPTSYARYLWPLAGFYVLSLIIGGGTLVAPGSMAYAVFISLFSIQGASVLCSLSRRLTGRFFPRLFLLALLLFVAPMSLYWIGLLDQFIDIRSLRRKKAQNNKFSL